MVTTAPIGLRGTNGTINPTGTYGPNGLVPASYMHDRPEGCDVQIVARNITDDYKSMGTAVRRMKEEEVSRVLARHTTNFVAGARKFVAKVMGKR